MGGPYNKDPTIILGYYIRMPRWSPFGFFVVAVVVLAVVVVMIDLDLYHRLGKYVGLLEDYKHKPCDQVSSSSSSHKLSIVLAGS